MKRRLKNNKGLGLQYVKSVKMIERAWRCKCFKINLNQMKFFVKEELLDMKLVN